MLSGQIINKEACCVKFTINNYEVSLACDTSCNKDGKLRRFYVKIFKGENDLTNEILENDEIIITDYNEFLNILKFVKKYSTIK